VVTQEPRAGQQPVHRGSRLHRRESHGNGHQELRKGGFQSQKRPKKKENQQTISIEATSERVTSKTGKNATNVQRRE